MTAVGSTYITPLSVPLCYRPPSEGGIDCTQPSMPFGEVAVSLADGQFWSTGGGFANEQAMPAYQRAAVQGYLQSAKLPPSSAFNATGRAYPDVSAVGHKCGAFAHGCLPFAHICSLMVALSGSFIPVDGTSASAPIFGGIVSLLNTARIDAGQPPLVHWACL